VPVEGDRFPYLFLGYFRSRHAGHFLSPVIFPRGDFADWAYLL